MCAHARYAQARSKHQVSVQVMFSYVLRVAQRNKILGTLEIVPVCRKRGPRASNLQKDFSTTGAAGRTPRARGDRDHALACSSGGHREDASRGVLLPASG